MSTTDSVPARVADALRALEEEAARVDAELEAMGPGAPLKERLRRRVQRDQALRQRDGLRHYIRRWHEGGPTGLWIDGYNRDKCRLTDEPERL